uniref:NADH dehydrogenase subunit 2 n=1 Tax=Clinostomum complanatum TaxID=235145 RepID=A0A0F6PKF6_CLICO|nr:NADH dehydrogenase subunit 2 [Clinostomum complanatum]AJR28001.1 NADH dehydrogenase subunit 2 [Clinostomum complanatum]
MRGLLSSAVGVSGVIVCSIVLLCSGDLVFLWLFLELGGLCLIPCFFLSGFSHFNSLFSYIVASSISSSFILFGVLYSDLSLFLFLGFLVKFGVFPFSGWVYDVVGNSNWLVVLCLSTFLKVPFVYICFFMGGSFYYVGSLFCSVAFIVFGLMFWLNTPNWYYCWCQVMLSSSAGLVLMGLCISLDILIPFFFVYLVWSVGCVCVLWSYFSKGVFDGLLSGIGFKFVFYFCVFFLTTPVSLALFYKLLSCYVMFSCGLVPLVCWSLYSVSEQWFLIKFIVSSVVPKNSLNVLSVV